MTNGNNDVRELEDLLTELEGQGALPVGAYAEEDDAVTQLMDAPLGEQEWMVQITPLDRRMMSTDQLVAELATGHLVTRDMLVWRSGMNDWTPITRVDELRAPLPASTLLSTPERRPLSPAPLPPPAPVPPPRVPSSVLGSPSPLGRAPLPPVPFAAPLPPAPSAPFAAPLPPVPSTPFGASRPLQMVPDVPPPVNGLPLLSSAFASPPPPAGGLSPDLESAFHLPPAAAVPVPPPATARVNTQRPVAVDFSEMEPTRAAPLRVLVGSGIAAALMIAGTVYALSAGGVFESTPEAAPTAAVASSSKPAAAPAPLPAAEAIAPKAAEPAEPAAPAAEAQTQPASVKDEPVAPAPVEKAAPEEKVAEAASKKEPAPEAEKAAESDKPDTEKVAAKGEDPEEKPKAVKSRSDDDSSSSGEKLGRRSKVARQKKAIAEEKESAPAPRRSKPRAAAVATEAAAQEADDTPKELPGSTFNRQAAKAALDDAAAQAKNCRPAGGPNGAGRVQVRYEPNGKVGAVSVLTPQFDNTTTGSCLVMVFRRASIPAFTGSPAVVMNKNFEIP